MLLASARWPLLQADLIKQRSMISQSGAEERDRVKTNDFEPVRVASCL